MIWIAVSITVAIFAMASRGWEWSPAGRSAFVEGVLNVALEPLGIVRGVRAETWLESQVSEDRQYLATLARVAVAMSLASMVVAVARRSRSGFR